ncbi:MAG: cation transporter [Thermosphaera sp.]
MNRKLALIIAGSIAGGFLKVTGGLIFGSNALFVDALTSFANLLALFAVLALRRRTVMPPDSDHHFGHERFEYVGVLITMLSYSFVAGISISRLASTREYRVGLEAFYLAVASIVAYAPPVLLSRRMSAGFRTYGEFTASEFIESGVGIVSTLGGAVYSYMIDYVGAIALTGFIFYELVRAGGDLIEIMVDSAPPLEVYETIVNEAGKHGFKIESLRLRKVSQAKFHGDLLLRGNPRSEDVAKFKAILKNNYGIDLCVEGKIDS